MKKKATHTKARLQWSIYFWRKLRKRLQHHLSRTQYGEAARIALALGANQSQIHRWADTCGCDTHHLQEPNFSQGCALLLYLESYLHRKHLYTILPDETIVTKK